MKWILIPLLFVAALSVASTQSSLEIEKELSAINLFSIGLNGFVAGEMP